VIAPEFSTIINKVVYIVSNLLFYKVFRAKTHIINIKENDILEARWLIGFLKNIFSIKNRESG